MNAIQIKNFRAVNLTLLFVFLISVFGCTSTEENRAMRQNEITNLYNEYVDEVATLSKEEILSKCDLAFFLIEPLAGGTGHKVNSFVSNMSPS